MKFDTRKKRAAAVAAIVIILAIIAGTFMWFTSQDSVKNEFALDRFDVKITEKFDPNTPIEPGKTIDKEVGIVNNSNIPAVARVQLQEEVWLPDLDGQNRVDIKYNENADEIPTNGVIVKVADAQIANLAASGYTEVTGPSVPGGVKLYSREVPKDDGSGTTTEYFAYVEGSKRLAKYDTTTGTFSYAYFQRSRVAGGIHNMTGNDLPTSPINFHDYITLNLINPAANGTNTPGWIPDTDTGWYYYSQAIPAGAQPLPIMSGVKFEEEMPDTWQGAKYVLTPKLEATQYSAGAIEDEWTDVLSGLQIWDNGSAITIP